MSPSAPPPPLLLPRYAELLVRPTSCDFSLRLSFPVGATALGDVTWLALTTRADVMTRGWG